MSVAAAAAGEESSPSPPPSPDRKRVKRGGDVLKLEEKKNREEEVEGHVVEEEEQNREEEVDDHVVEEEKKNREEEVEGHVVEEEEESHGEELEFQVEEEEPVVIVPNDIGDFMAAPIEFNLNVVHVDLNEVPEDEGLDIIPNQLPVVIAEHPDLAEDHFLAPAEDIVAVAPREFNLNHLPFDLNEVPEDEGLNIIADQLPVVIPEHLDLAEDNIPAPAEDIVAVAPAEFNLNHQPFDLNEVPQEEGPDIIPNQQPAVIQEDLNLAEEDFPELADDALTPHAAVNQRAAQLPVFQVLEQLNPNDVWSTNEMEHWTHNSHDVEAQAIIDQNAHIFEEK